MWIEKLVNVNRYTRPGTKLKGVRKIVEHYTANPGASAYNHYKYFNGTAIQQKRSASAHIFIDKQEAYLIIPLDEVAYHANDGTYRGVPELRPNANLYSIGIELCIEKDGSFHPETIHRAEDITAELCKRFNLDPLDDVVRHYDVTRKNCPARWVSHPNEFTDFKNRVKARVTSGWVLQSGKWYYFKDGVRQTGWIKDKGVWYYLDLNGIMQTGWVKVNNKWYYLNPNGSIKTGWLLDKGKWYFLNADGSMATGEVVVNGKKYYLQSSGAMAVTDSSGAIQ